MTREVVDETNDGRFRVVIETDEYADQPDADAQGHVFGISFRCGTRVEVLNEDTPPIQGEPDAEEIGAYIARQLDRGQGCDWERLERKLAARFSVVSVARYDRRDGGVFLNVVTETMCDLWGIPAGAPIRTESTSLSEWIAWDEGDVWIVDLEQSREECLVDRGRITGDITCAACGRECECLMCQTDAPEKRWESVETIGGFYGREWAIEFAREQLAGTGVRA